VTIKLTQIMKSQGIRVKMFFSFQITHTPYGIFVRFRLQIIRNIYARIKQQIIQDTRIR
jgi:hypothetical protein